MSADLVGAARLRMAKRNPRKQRWLLTFMLLVMQSQERDAGDTRTVYHGLEYKAECFKK